MSILNLNSGNQLPVWVLITPLNDFPSLPPLLTPLPLNILAAFIAVSSLHNWRTLLFELDFFKVAHEAFQMLNTYSYTLVQQQSKQTKIQEDEFSQNLPKSCLHSIKLTCMQVLKSGKTISKIKETLYPVLGLNIMLINQFSKSTLAITMFCNTFLPCLVEPPHFVRFFWATV